MSIRELLAAHPNPPRAHPDEVVRCIELCHACEAACVVCADACLAEQDSTRLRRCISLNLTCADVCAATARVSSRMTAEENQMFVPLLHACEEICSICAAECARHEAMEHCRICADTCRRCEDACRTLADSTPRVMSTGA